MLLVEGDLDRGEMLDQLMRPGEKTTELSEV